MKWKLWAKFIRSTQLHSDWPNCVGVILFFGAWLQKLKLRSDNFLTCRQHCFFPCGQWVRSRPTWGRNNLQTLRTFQVARSTNFAMQNKKKCYCYVLKVFSPHNAWMLSDFSVSRNLQRSVKPLGNLFSFHSWHTAWVPRHTTYVLFALNLP